LVAFSIRMIWILHNWYTIASGVHAAERVNLGGRTSFIKIVMRCLTFGGLRAPLRSLRRLRLNCLVCNIVFFLFISLIDVVLNALESFFEKLMHLYLAYITTFVSVGSWRWHLTCGFRISAHALRLLLHISHNSNLLILRLPITLLHFQWAMDIRRIVLLARTTSSCTALTHVLFLFA